MTHNRSAPTGVVTPVLIYDDVGDAIDGLRDVDPTGHWWTFSQHIADVPPAVWGAIEAQTSS